MRTTAIQLDKLEPKPDKAGGQYAISAHTDLT